MFRPCSIDDLSTPRRLYPYAISPFVIQLLAVTHHLVGMDLPISLPQSLANSAQTPAVPNPAREATFSLPAGAGASFSTPASQVNVAGQLSTQATVNPDYISHQGQFNY